MLKPTKDKLSSSTEPLSSTQTPNQNEHKMVSNLNIRSVPVKINLDSVNLKDDSFLNDLEMVDFESSFESVDNEQTKFQKLNKNLQDFQSFAKSGKELTGEDPIKQSVMQKEEEQRNLTNNQNIKSNLNFSSKLPLLSDAEISHHETDPEDQEIHSKASGKLR